MDLVALDLPLKLYDHLRKHAAALECQAEDLLEDILQTSMEPDEPERKRVKLECNRCGFTNHKWARAKPIGKGEFAHLYGCVKCFRLRRYGTTTIKGWLKLQLRLVEDDELPCDAPVRASRRGLVLPCLWLVPGLMYPGVPEALQ